MGFHAFVGWCARIRVGLPCAGHGLLAHPNSADTRKPDVQVLDTRRLPGWRPGLRQTMALLRWIPLLLVLLEGQIRPNLPAPGLGRERRPGEPGSSTSAG